MIELAVTMPRLFAEGPSTVNVSFSIEAGSVTALVGPSGSGKTTILRLLAGLETPPQGYIRVHNTVWLDTRQRLNQPPQQRSIGYVFQDTALFPNMTVLENIRYAAPQTDQTLVRELIEWTGLEGLTTQKPIRLSGGQRQRVALARALVRKPQLLLLDEPFAALDADASQALSELLMRLHLAWGTTTLLVSHHLLDVERLADRVIRLAQGRVVADEKRSETHTETPEQIVRLDWDAQQQQWLIETTHSQIRSRHPVWAKRQVGEWVRLD